MTNSPGSSVRTDSESEGLASPPAEGRSSAGDRSAHVKQTVRDHAFALFALRGYSATGVRDIAAAAGVDPAIVIRHFGSKEALFLQTMSMPAAWSEAIEGPLSEVGQRMAEIIVRSQSGGLRIYAALMRASDRPEIAARLQHPMTEAWTRPLISRLGGPDAEIRAHFFAAQLQGLMDAIALREDEFLVRMPPEELIARYGKILQDTLTGDLFT